MKGAYKVIILVSTTCLLIAGWCVYDTLFLTKPLNFMGLICWSILFIVNLITIGNIFVLTVRDYVQEKIEEHNLRLVAVDSSEDNNDVIMRLTEEKDKLSKELTELKKKAKKQKELLEQKEKLIQEYLVEKEKKEIVEEIHLGCNFDNVI